MISRGFAHTLVGICGNVTALILFLSPTPVMVKICKQKSVQQYSAAPYLATFFNCGLWVLYALPMIHPKSILVMTINFAGTLIELTYLTIFFLYSEKKEKAFIVGVIVTEIIFMAALLFLDLHFVNTWQLRSTIIGSFAVVGCILMYASPLSVMKLVITTKSVEYMPLFLSVCSFGNAICWTIYATIKFEPFVLGPNGVGVLLGLAQLILYAMYCNAEKIVEQKHVDMELGMGKKSLSTGKK